jgi:hypothetical protein
MNLCSDNHDEICYECKKCPMCELMAEYKQFKTDAAFEVKTLSQENERLTEALEEPLNRIARGVALTMPQITAVK